MVSYTLAPAPKWYFLDATGRPAVGGTMRTFSSLDGVTPKPVFRDSGGVSPYPNPIILDGTGGTPVPMYWEVDGADRYYLEVGDANGNLIFTINDYPLIVGGGGPPVTNTVDIENHLINGNFHFLEDQFFGGTLTPVPTGVTKVAPASGWFTNSSNELSEQSSDGLASGWIFRKTGGANLNDTIKFVATTPGQSIPQMPTENAPRYFEYELAGAGDPVTELNLACVIPNARFASGQNIIISFDVNSTASGGGGPTVAAIEQDFGTGGAPSFSIKTTAPFTFPDGSITTAWTRLSVNILVPTVAGKTFGTDNNSRILIYFQIPFNVSAKFQLTNLQLQVGANLPTDYIRQTYSQVLYKILIDKLVGAFPVTGDVKVSINRGVVPGWIKVSSDSETIGSTASLAFHNGDDKQALYELIWNGYTDSNAPVTGGRGASGAADFNANKQMRMPQICGRAIGLGGQGIGLTNRNQLSIFGEEDHLLTTNEMPSHHHSIFNQPDIFLGDVMAGPTSFLTDGTMSAITGNTGGGQTHNNMQPTHFLVLYIKL